jgi:hypothetical protein
MDAPGKTSNRILAGLATALGVAIGVTPGALLAQATTQAPAPTTQAQPAATTATPNAAAAKYWKLKVQPGVTNGTGTAQVQPTTQTSGTAAAVQSKGIVAVPAVQSKVVPVQQAPRRAGPPDTTRANVSTRKF